MTPEHAQRQAPRAAYVHVPFCRHHCGYCNFTVVAGREDLVEPYLRALAIELSWLGDPRPVETLYVGGGTPTRLEADDLRTLLRVVQEWFPPQPGAEITVEANPRNLDGSRAEVLADAGVNRVSLGAQSFDSQKLRLLERDHTSDDIERALNTIRPFADVSLDLIFGTPGETCDRWVDDLAKATHLEPAHVSTYGLTFEKGTTFWGRLRRGDLQQLPEGEELAMYEAAIDRLTGAGFEHYEVSNFARRGHRCRHNEVYWSGEEYFAAGPGAARYVDGWRETNHRSTTTYIQRILRGESPVAERECLAPEDRAREALVLGLRRRDGVCRDAFHARFGYRVDELLGSQREWLLGQGWLEEAADRVWVTPRGLMVSDAIWPRILRC